MYDHLKSAGTTRYNPAEPYHALLGAVLKSAVDVASGKSACYTANRPMEQQHAQNFIFGEHLDNFIDFWNLPIEANYVRKKVREVIDGTL